MTSKESFDIINKNFIKKTDDIIELQLSKDENKFSLNIYFSKNKSSIIFKIKYSNIVDYYYYEKFDLRDFSQKYKIIISDKNIEEAFKDIKNIISNSHKIEIESKKNTIELFFHKEDEEDIVFILRKKNINQNKVNQILIEKIEENLKKLNNAKIIMDNYGESIDNQENIINNIYDKIDNLNNRIQNVLNEINTINNDLKNPESSKENKKIEIKKEFIKSKFCSIHFLFFSIIFLFIFAYYLFNLSNMINNDIDFIITQDEIINERLPIFESILKLRKKNEYQEAKIALEYNKNGKIKSKYNEHNNFIINRYYKHLNNKNLNVALDKTNHIN